MRREIRNQAGVRLTGTVLLFLFLLPAFACAGSTEKVCGPVRDSKAYQQYKLRPESEFSKLIFLIDHFAACNIEVVYDGHYFKALFAARVARWFLATNYKKESTREWIKRWCTNTIPRGTPIYVKLPNGKFRLAREVLTEEIEELERVAKQDSAMIAKEMQMAPIANLMVKSPASASPRIEPSR